MKHNVSVQNTVPLFPPQHTRGNIICFPDSVQEEHQARDLKSSICLACQREDRIVFYYKYLMYFNRAEAKHESVSGS